MTTPVGPREPRSIAEAGLAESTIESLLLKILYFRGELYGRDLSLAVGLKFSVIQDVVEALKLRHQVQVKRSLGVGNVSALWTLTDAGRERAREALEANRYTGPAPVPVDQYVEIVRQQRPQQGWLTRGALKHALSGMVITEHLLSQIGPAISSANSLLLYGKPGDGKTFLIESLNNLESAPVFVPHAIECQGNIVQVYDPVYHHRLDADEAPESVLLEAVGNEAAHDGRWVKCRRPFIVSGGELSLDMLDLRFNDISKIYEAPFQLKANNGIYLIDDFGRQRATPAEVLNRWIVPMERRVDYLSFMTGGKLTAPFETFLVFSTNLNPADLGDEAFLRRIQYKMLLRGPSKVEFLTILENFCRTKKLVYRRDVVESFIEKYYRRSAKVFRRCQPRDVLTHALNLMHFEDLPRELTGDILGRAFESCFLQDDENAPDTDTALVRPPVKTCSEYWAARVRAIETVFGRLKFLASLRDGAAGVYQDAAAARDYAPAEISSTLAGMHSTAFRDWLGLNLEEQDGELKEYFSTLEGRAALLNLGGGELADTLTPADARDEERELFRNDLAGVTEVLSPKLQREEPVEEQLLECTA